MIKLTKKHEMDGYRGGLPWFYDDEYISNGKFMVRKSLVKDAHKLCLAVTPGFVMPDLKRPIPTDIAIENGIRVSKTANIVDNGFRYNRIYFDANGKSYHMDDDLHLMLLADRDDIVIIDDVMFCTMDKSIIVMAVRA